MLKIMVRMMIVPMFMYQSALKLLYLPEIRKSIPEISVILSLLLEYRVLSRMIMRPMFIIRIKDRFKM